LAQTFERCVQAIRAPNLIPDAVAESRMRELLAWLSHMGFVFASGGPVSVQRKVRLTIGMAPEKNWIAKDLALALAMSEATFRRKLAEEGQSFSGILVDVRMSYALTLLQVTDTPISGIAYQVGYESASRFSVRFKKRFGFSPNAIRDGLAD
jgi:AraC-like DNA-binding protein